MPGPGFLFIYNEPVDSISHLPLPNPKPLLFFLAYPKMHKDSYCPGAGVSGTLNEIKYTLW